MPLIYNYTFAWISVILVFILSIKILIRKGSQKKWIGKNYCISFNKCLRKTHKPMGIILVISGLVHGLCSSVSVFSINTGTLCWLFSIFLGLNFIIRKKLNHFKPWIVIHRVMAGFMIVLLIWHIIHIGGVRVFQLIASQTDSISNEQDNHDKSPNEENANAFFDGDIELQDGTYTGTAEGYRGDITVSVTVSDGMITSVEIVSTNDDYKFYSRAEQGISDEIIKNQTLDVDAVSGATYSSQGIINAVNNALQSAVTSGELPESSNQKDEQPADSNHKTDGEHSKRNWNRKGKR